MILLKKTCYVRKTIFVVDGSRASQIELTVFVLKNILLSNRCHHMSNMIDETIIKFRS